MKWGRLKKSKAKCKHCNSDVYFSKGLYKKYYGGKFDSIVYYYDCSGCNREWESRK